MAISRVSDLTELSNYWSGIQPGQAGTVPETKNMAKSFLEISWNLDDPEGRYESKAMTVDTLKDYIAKTITENDYYYNTIHCFQGAVLSGHVGINEDAKLESIDEDYGIVSLGGRNALQAKYENYLQSLDKTTIESKTIDVNASDDINIATDGDGINVQSKHYINTAAEITYITSKLSTVLALPDIDTHVLEASPNSVWANALLHAPTPDVEAEDIGSITDNSKLKEVVNIEYLKKYSAWLIKDIIAQLTADDPGQSEQADDSMNVYGISGKLFELKTFDYKLSEVASGSLKKRNLWLLGSTISDANEATPNLYKVLESIKTSNAATKIATYSASNDISVDIQYKEDEYGHKVYVGSSYTEDKNKALDITGTFWFYHIDTAANKIYLPYNNMYFRSGANGTTTTELGSYLKPSLPQIDAIPSVMQQINNGTMFHGHYGKYSLQKKTIRPTTLNSDHWVYDSTSGLVAPPSVQIYTYMVCF